MWCEEEKLFAIIAFINHGSERRQRQQRNYERECDDKIALIEKSKICWVVEEFKVMWCNSVCDVITIIDWESLWVVHMLMLERICLGWERRRELVMKIYWKFAELLWNFWLSVWNFKDISFGASKPSWI